jgi:hypothetical protein
LDFSSIQRYSNPAPRHSFADEDPPVCQPKHKPTDSDKLSAFISRLFLTPEHVGFAALVLVPNNLTKSRLKYFSPFALVKAEA